ncbi:YecA family protein [Archangium primigenium]|uniref:YecA family protein n=1 Tax=[Archangium] primigenium TaxID=2792470 RepID=UPI00195BF64C|nr:SEC-C domain-containing protein [Archangium primigenium]
MGDVTGEVEDAEARWGLRMCSGAVSPEGAWVEVLARGEAAAAPLERILEEGDEDAIATYQAAILLSRLSLPRSVGPMARRLMRTEIGSPLQEALVENLSSWGTAVAPAVLEVLDTAPDADARLSLLRVLAECGARDERILAALLADLASNDVIPAVINLVRYGDPAARAPLSRMLDDYVLNDAVEDLFAQQEVRELASGLLSLGGTLSDAQSEKVEQAWRLGEPLRARLRRMTGERPGRNTPCWCGSGVKYKKCHLGSER